MNFKIMIKFDILYFQLASKYWAPNVNPNQYLPYDAQVVENIYNEEIFKSK